MIKSLLHFLAFCLVFCVANTSDKPTYLDPVKHAKNTVSVQEMTTEEVCLSIAVYKEAGNQPYVGQMSVIAVIFNRVKKQHMSICQVVMQKGAFSWYYGRYSLTPTEQSVTFIPIARRAIEDRKNGKFVDYTHGATHFHSRSVKPWWATPKHTIKLVTIGGHTFYKQKED